jgi:hypothetical protein
VNATISNSGELTAKKEGTYTVTATSKDDATKFAVATIYVKSMNSANPGDIITIDGTDWIKIRNDYVSNNKYTLLMLKDAVGSAAQYHNIDHVANLEYNQASIRNTVNSWFSNLYSPKLKAIYVQANLGAGTSKSWPNPNNNTGIHAFIPRKVDVSLISAELRKIGKDYWLATPTESSGALDFQETVKADGTYSLRNNTGTAYIRPSVWVLAP